MSSPASRQRQRHRRRASERLHAAQAALAERHVDLVSYERVIADMSRRFRDEERTSFCANALGLVVVFRDTTRAACAKLEADITALKTAREKLNPPESPAP